MHGHNMATSHILKSHLMHLVLLDLSMTCFDGMKFEVLAVGNTRYGIVGCDTQFCGHMPTFLRTLLHLKHCMAWHPRRL
jgi:hypothetical protein